MQTETKWSIFHPALQDDRESRPLSPTMWFNFLSLFSRTFHTAPAIIIPGGGGGSIHRWRWDEWQEFMCGHVRGIWRLCVLGKKKKKKRKTRRRGQMRAGARECLCLHLEIVSRASPTPHCALRLNIAANVCLCFLVESGKQIKGGKKRLQRRAPPPWIVLIRACQRNGDKRVTAAFNHSHVLGGTR